MSYNICCSLIKFTIYELYNTIVIVVMYISSCSIVKGGREKISIRYKPISIISWTRALKLKCLRKIPLC